MNEQLQLPIQLGIKCGDLLIGGRVFTSEGVTEWHDFPRYKVVALHSNGEDMFVEVLNAIGETLTTQKHSMASNQWRLVTSKILEKNHD